MDLSRLESALWPNGAARDIWMILDGARDRRIFTALLDSSAEHACLYSGSLSHELEAAAPHLLQLEFEDKFTRRLLERAWGNHWGILLKSDAGLAKLRRHLRGFLVARDWKGKPFLFRYYDPRVLRVYLPTCNTEELRTVFGPIECFWTEGESAGELLAFRLDPQRTVLRAEPARLAASAND